jgi:hypothetical protein
VYAESAEQLSQHHALGRSGRCVVSHGPGERCCSPKPLRGFQAAFAMLVPAFLTRPVTVGDSCAPFDFQ